MKMALKSLVFVLLLAAGHGHVGAGVGRVEVREAEAQLSNIFAPLFSIRIGGILFCTPNGNMLMGVNATATPVFPNASVQLQCGGTGSEDVISSATTNSDGVFSMVFNPYPLLVSIAKWIRDCNLVVKTPLSDCNSALPSSGTLVSPLTLLGNTLQGGLSIFNFISPGFHLSPS